MFEEGIEKDGPQDQSEVPQEGVSAVAGKRTLDTLEYADAVSEAIEMVEEEALRQREHEVMPLCL